MPIHQLLTIAQQTSYDIFVNHIFEVVSVGLLSWLTMTVIKLTNKVAVLESKLDSSFFSQLSRMQDSMTRLHIRITTLETRDSSGRVVQKMNDTI